MNNSALNSVLRPGATIGIIGGGQLGRMLAMAAAHLGFETVILEPQADCPAAQVANRQIIAAYDDPKALAELAAASDVITYEFENVPVSAADRLAETALVFPPRQRLKSRRIALQKSSSSTPATSRRHPGVLWTMKRP